MIPVSLLFTILGIYAWRRKKPMQFWSGSTVKESEIKDIPAYNRANGIMWLCFSAVLWLSVILSFLGSEAGGIVMFVCVIAGVVLLPFAYGKIFKKYKR